MADFTDLIEIASATSIALPAPDDITAFFDPTAPIVVITPIAANLTANGVVTVEATDDRTLALLVVRAGDELVYDGAAFAGAYATSVKTAIPQGVRLEIRRTSGWRKTASISAIAVDGGGNVVTATRTYAVDPFVPPVAGAPPGLVYQPDHPGEAEARLLAQFDDSAKLHALVRALVSPLQQLEQDAFSVLGAFDVDEAYGAQLDIVGGMVGQLREARSDVAYRAYIKAKILANASDGTSETILRIARMLLGPDLISLTLLPGHLENHPAHYDLWAAATTLKFPWDELGSEAPDTVGRSVADALFLATSSGVSLTLFYQFTDDPNTFVFASGDAEEDSAAQGLADASDEDATGGALIGAEERF